MTTSTLLLVSAALSLATLLGYFIVDLLWPPEISRKTAWAIAPGVGAGLCSVIFFLFRRPMFTVEFTLVIGFGVVWILRHGAHLPNLRVLESWRPSILALFLTGALAAVLSGLMLKVNVEP